MLGIYFYEINSTSHGVKCRCMPLDSWSGHSVLQSCYSYGHLWTSHVTPRLNLWTVRVGICVCHLFSGTRLVASFLAISLIIPAQSFQPLEGKVIMASKPAQESVAVQQDECNSQDHECNQQIGLLSL